MNDFTSLIAKAVDHYQTAEHLFQITFPVTRDPKLLLGIVKSISNCLEYTIGAILIKEKITLPEGLLKKINALRDLAKKYHLSSEDIVFMLRIQELLYRQKQSPIEFKRGNTHVICSEDYDLEVVSAKEVEEFLQQTKRILNLLKSS